MQRLRWFAAVLLLSTPAAAQQRIQFPQANGYAAQGTPSYGTPTYSAPSPQPYATTPGYQGATGTVQPYAGSTVQPYTGSPVQPYTGSPVQPYTAPSNGGGLINVPPVNGGTTPGFDPYSTGPDAASIPPSLPADPNLAPYGSAAPYYGGTSPYGGVSPYGAPPGVTLGAPQGTYPPGTYAPGAYPPGTYPPGAFPPTTPNSLFPNGFGGNPIQPAPWGPPLRLLYGPRLRYTWVMPEDEPKSLGINDFDVSVALALPNFLGSGQPIFFIPSFSLHLWEGPKPPVMSDLPSRAYSGFIDIGWQSDVQQQLGLELGARLGVFTDFDTFTTHSFRTLGQAMGRIRISPTLTLRGGVAYIDRNDIKLVPVGGLLWEPNTMTRFDIFFPEPRLAQYLTTVGTQALWWYIAGEYGGGSWTIERDSGVSDRIDINDIRVSVGLEWGQPNVIAQGRRLGFFEVGWVTDRKVIFVTDPSENFRPRDSLMLRAGIGY